MDESMPSSKNLKHGGLKKLDEKEKKIWDQIFQKCAELIYEQLAAYGWDQKFIGYQEGGI